MCTVWKNGIRWVNENGIETVVEIVGKLYHSSASDDLS